MKEKALDPNRWQKILGANGFVSQVLQGFEPRESQIHMALMVEKALEEDETLLAEAPTGTGKTLSYLLPAVMASRKIVISTSTLNLQAQIIKKDLPLVEKALGVSVRSAVMKGRSNYICKARLASFMERPYLEKEAEAAVMTRIIDWTETTKTGDRAELDFMPDDFAPWSMINSHSAVCRGSRCKWTPDCFVNKMRRAAAAADLIVVNHHLFFADLAVKDKGPGEVIPEYHSVIFDEAHDLEDAITNNFTVSVSNYQFEEWDRDVTKALEASKASDKKFAKAVRIAWPKFLEHFQNAEEARDRLEPVLSKPLVLKDFNKLIEALQKASSALDDLAEEMDSQELEGLAERTKQLGKNLEFIASADDASFAYWREVKGRGVFLNAAPIEVSDTVREKLLARVHGLIFTSATLTASDGFSYFRNRLGLDHEVIETVLPECFDHASQALLYTPGDLPDPRSDDFFKVMADRTRQLVMACKGRTMVLCTSLRQMESLFDRLSRELPFHCMMQGQAPKHVLLENFRSETESVLFASSSFFTGVDVVGPALSCVILDKLPFDAPGDPLVQARIDMVRISGGEPFRDYQLPRAILVLKQALGRLLRSRADRGLLAVMDSRLVTKGYGKIILRSLPPFSRTADLRQAQAFAAEL